MKIALLLALIAVLIGTIMMARQYYRIEKSTVSWGKVTDLPMSPSSDSDGTTYKILASFKDHKGIAWVYESSWASSSPGYKVGDDIRIFYDPNNPQDNGMMTFMGSYGSMFILTLVGFFASLIFLALIYSSQILEIVHSDKFINIKTESPKYGASF